MSRIQREIRGILRLMIFLSTMLASILVLAGDRIRTAVDVSSSMEGSRIRAAREGLKLLAAIADSDDELVVVSFSDTANSQSYSLASTADRYKAMRAIDGIVANGSTNYLSALQCPDLVAGNRAAFFSDGEHGGTPQELFDFVRTKLPAGLELRTIGVECETGGPAETALMQMASLTGGSYARASTSEEIVRQFVELAIRQGAYRGHQPSDDTVTLNGAVGRVLVFAYDGDVAIEGGGSPFLHRAELPGERVSFASVDCASPADLVVRLTNSTGKHSRLGDVYVSYLPSQQFNVDVPNGTVATGSSVRTAFGFSDKGGQNVDPAGNATATVDVLDALGQVTQSVPANAAANGQLEAVVQVPSKEGTITLRGTSSWETDGRGFTQSDERTLQVRQAPELMVSPQRVTGTYGARKGFVVPIKVTWKNTGDVPQEIQADVSEAIPGLNLKSAKASDVGVDVEFVADRIGMLSGTFEVRAAKDGLEATSQVPFEFKIITLEKGLQEPAVRRVTLPPTIAGGGTGTIKIDFSTIDKVPLKYSLSVSDLASGSAAIPLSLDAQTIEVVAGKPGVVTLNWEADDVPPGKYLGSITAATDLLPDAEWVTELSLSVTPSLSADRVEFGQVAAGRIVDGAFEIRNLSPKQARGISVRVIPVLGPMADQVNIEVDGKEFSIAAGVTRRVPIKVAASPLMKERGVLEATLEVVKSGVVLLQVPLRMTIVDPSNQPIFSASPKTLSLHGAPGDLVQFQLLLRATSQLIDATELTVSAGAFNDANGNPFKVAASAAWDGGNQLKRVAATAKVKGAVVCPTQSGQYTGSLEISGSNGESTTVAIQLTVK